MIEQILEKILEKQQFQDSHTGLTVNTVFSEDYSLTSFETRDKYLIINILSTDILIYA